MLGWHHQHDGHKLLEQAPGVGDGQGSLVCLNPWGHKESDTTEPSGPDECKSLDFALIDFTI